MRYPAENQIASGGFANIYRGQDPAHRPAAIKVYHEEFSDEDIIQVLTNSVRTHKLLIGRFRFPKLYCHDDRTLVMEFIDGVNLDTLDRRQTEAEALATGYQLAICLSEFHGSRPEKPPIHRDVKPKNIIAKRNGELVLCDFDLAVIDENSVDGSERIIGTPQYLSPEQIKGTLVLPISDLFSVGSTLYKLVTGKVLRNCCSVLPIDEETKLAILNLQGHVEEVVSTCWRVGRSYESAEHMAKELAERLRRLGIDPEKSHEVLAGLATEN